MSCWKNKGLWIVGYVYLNSEFAQARMHCLNMHAVLLSLYHRLPAYLIIIAISTKVWFKNRRAKHRKRVKIGKSEATDTANETTPNAVQHADTDADTDETIENTVNKKTDDYGVKQSIVKTEVDEYEQLDSEVENKTSLAKGKS